MIKGAGKMKASLIVTTYNWPEALEATLLTAIKQNCSDYEIIVADDGSDDRTREVISRIKNTTKCHVTHVWQKDKGFRAAAARNKAISKASGHYVIFIDGDCLLPPTFISDHLGLAERGFFVAGSRVKFTPSMTNNILNKSENVPDMSRIALFKLWLVRKVKRVHPLIKLPFMKFRHSRSGRWQGAVTCNMAVWRDDLIAINGFDNDFVGWGLEDSELVARLFNLGVKRKEGKMYSFVGHLHHEERSRDEESVNKARLEKSLYGNRVVARSGINELSEIE